MYQWKSFDIITMLFSCYLLQIGATNVSFIDRRISFGQVPLHQTTARTAMLKNNSLNHAYFQVQCVIY